ncbi:hypothetical protein K7G98_19420 [Saccharothrix sp. MB29]|nr:hypothetical protein [Saccharothrix sp. MB29]
MVRAAARWWSRAAAAKSPRPRARGGLGQRVGLPVPRPRREDRAVPRPARTVGQGLGERGVRLVALGQREFGDQRGPHERARVHQRRGLLHRRDGQAGQPHEGVHVQLVVHQHQAQRAPGIGGEGVEAGAQPGPRGAARRQHVRWRLDAAELGAGQRPGQLDQRQRVAARRAGHVVRQLTGQAGQQVAQHPDAGGVVQRVDLHAGQAGQRAVGGDEHRDRLVLQLREHVEQPGQVEAVRVVHAQQGAPRVGREVRRSVPRRAQQRRPAGPGLAVQHQHAAPAGAGAVEHRVHGDALPVASAQHVSFLPGAARRR